MRRERRQNDPWSGPSSPCWASISSADISPHKPGPNLGGDRAAAVDWSLPEYTVHGCMSHRACTNKSLIAIPHIECGRCSIYTKVKVKSLSHVCLFVTPWAVACTRLLRPWDFLGKSTGVGCHFLLQEIFPTQGSNPGLLHCRQMLYHLNHQGSPIYILNTTLNAFILSTRLHSLTLSSQKPLT